MKKIFETPTIEIIFFDQNVSLSASNNGNGGNEWGGDDNVDNDGWT